MNHANHRTNWVEQTISVWTTNNIKLQLGLSLEKITNFERQLGFKFPQDFIDLYEKVNGFEDFEWNTAMFSLWSLDRVLNEYQDSDNKNYIRFCDYFINSHAISFYKDDHRIYKDYGSHYGQPQVIAGTFQEFINLLNSDDLLLY